MSPASLETTHPGGESDSNPRGTAKPLKAPEDRLSRIQRRGTGDMQTRARVLVADDHALTRAGLRALLAEDPDLELVGEATTGREAVALTQSLRPDLVLMDVRMPDTDGLEATRALKQTDPMTTVLILSMFEDAELLIEAVKAGAAGYVLKTASESGLRSAMWDALAGNFPVDQHLAREVLRRVANDIAPAQPVPPAGVLSAREREVLELLTRGFTNREIAERLIITQSTVKVHVEHILAKLGVSDRTQAAVRAIELGYVSPEQFHGARALHRERSAAS
jgi:DNA-binding NarL/FixJ family response regulator